MKINSENSVWLYGQAMQLQELLRPVLQVQNFDDVDHQNFKFVLINLRDGLNTIIINDYDDSEDSGLFVRSTKEVLNPAFKPSPIFDESTLKIMNDFIHSNNKQGRYEKTLNNILISLLDSPVQMTYTDRIETAFKMTDEVIAELEKRGQ
jgi:hypothetical protein